MRRGVRGLALAAMVAGSGGAGVRGLQPDPRSGTPDPARYALVPRPASLEPRPGAFVPGPETRVVLEPIGDPALRAAADFWLDELRERTGLALAPSVPGRGPSGVGSRGSGSGNRIVFRLDPDDPSSAEPAPFDPDADAYRLEITPDAILLTASTARGIFYGVQTLRQLSASARSGGTDGEPGARSPAVPAVSIEDRPRFGYRGLHLDVGRHWFPVAFIERYIDLLARFKLNAFHWHLTEDQGWRIEIRSYPRLTGVGAWRRETVVGKDFDPYVGDGTPYGGFYTQAEVREIVAYAAARHVTVIPEIEMPGHSLAALAAYPELACTDGPFEVGTRWGVYEDIYCPGEATFEFLETVLTEVLELFPGPYVHVGGDEAPRTRWRESPLAQRIIREQGLADEAELQSWFMRRIERFLASRGRRMIGWDEILEGGLPSGATVMSWRSMEGGIEAARQGHDVIMTPGSHLYFDHYQSRDRASEPLAIGGFTPLEKVYAFDPVPDELDAQAAAHVLGAQANLWTEYIRTPAHAEYMAYPRALALAEVVWSPRESRDLEDFRQRLVPVLAGLDRLGVRFRRPEFLDAER